MTLLKKKINKISNKKLTLWEEILCIILIIFVFIGFIYTTIFCLNLIVDTYDYVTSLTTKDEVINIIAENNTYLLKTSEFKETVADIVHDKNFEDYCNNKGGFVIKYDAFYKECWGNIKLYNATSTIINRGAKE